MLNKIGAFCLIVATLFLAVVLTMQILEARELSVPLLPFLG